MNNIHKKAVSGLMPLLLLSLVFIIIVGISSSLYYSTPLYPGKATTEWVPGYQLAIPAESEAVASAYLQAALVSGKTDVYQANRAALEMYGVPCRGIISQAVYPSGSRHDRTFTPYHKCPPELQALIDAAYPAVNKTDTDQ